jgi:hypothetical protein
MLISLKQNRAPRNGNCAWLRAGTAVIVFVASRLRGSLRFGERGLRSDGSEVGIAVLSPEIVGRSRKTWDTPVLSCRAKLAPYLLPSRLKAKTMCVGDLLAVIEKSLERSWVWADWESHFALRFRRKAPHAQR